MTILDRRGVIGFMLTMAVGIALGAAALVVSNEMTRDNDKDRNKSKSGAVSQGSPVNVEKAFAEYQKAYRDYQQAVGLGREDLKKYGEILQDAKKKLEIEIFRNTPGVSEMDLTGLTGSDSSDAAVAADRNETRLMSFDAAASPFAGGEIAISQTATSRSSATSGSEPSTSAVSATSDPELPAAVGDDRISGIDFYRLNRAIRFPQSAADIMAKAGCGSTFSNTRWHRSLLRRTLFFRGS
jgi:hypothetical protein